MKPSDNDGKDRPGRIRASFLVRCYREDHQWRFLLEHVNTREKKVFDTVEGLVFYVTEWFKKLDECVN